MANPILEGAGDVWDWWKHGTNPITDPGGIIGPGGQYQPGGATRSDAGALIATMREAVGGPYWNWYSGGDGKHNNTMAEAKVNGESCSGIFVLAFRVLGMEPPFVGTYDAASLISGNGGASFESGKEYPVGTVFVSTAGNEGHMGIITGPGNVTLQSVMSRGITEGLTLEETASWGPEFTPDVVGLLPGFGTAEAAGAAVSNIASDIAEGVAQGVAKAFIRIIRVIYALAILWPIDFISGFWWELTKRLAGYYATITQQADIIGILLGREDAQLPDLSNPPERGELFSAENVNRMFFAGALILTYHLAYGRDQSNNDHISNLFGGADRAGIGLDRGRKGYNEESAVSAVVSRRVKGGRVGPLYEPGMEEDSSVGTRRTRRTPDRDGSTGKFKPKKNTERQGETAKQNFGGETRRRS